MFTTDPGQGERIRKDGTVAFTVSKGPDYVAVPDGVLGKPCRPRRRPPSLAAASWSTYAEPQYVDTVGDRQRHQRDAPRRHPRRARRPRPIRGTTVTLTLSNGPAPVTITSVVGMTLDDAAGQLDADNLTLAPTEVFHDTVAAGRIIDQSPVAGTEGHRGDTIAVNVSKGPEMLALPSTYGQNVKTARSRAAGRRFVVKVEHPQGISPLNIVYSQKPEGGEGKTAPRGSTIIINVF